MTEARSAPGGDLPPAERSRDTPSISVVVPVLDEEESLEPLHAKLSRVLDGRGPFEIIFVDDGSTDGGPEVMDRLASADPHVGVIHLARNFGKAAALDAGFALARGSVIFTMDADLQDDPEEIPAFLAKLDEGYDLVSGWKKIRHDPVGKRWPSKLFNFVVGRVSGLRLNDFNCGFKAYRRHVAKRLSLYGDLHRYTPVLAFWNGGRVTEIPVRHHPRQHGRSKYGIERLPKGFFDLLTILLLTRYRARPLHLFGLGGLFISLLGGGILAYLTVHWFLDLGPIGTRPLLFLGLLLMMVGVQLVSVGLLGEMISGMHHSSMKSYVVRETIDPGTLADTRSLPGAVDGTSPTGRPKALGGASEHATQ